MTNHPDATIHAPNNQVLLNQWHTIVPDTQNTTEMDTTWLHMYNRHTYLHHIITAQSQNSIEYQIRTHLRSWKAR
eukprot:8019091-Prorocentrum_lima.AAC.1